MRQLNNWKIKQLTLTAAFLALIILFRFITFATATIFMGYGIQIHYLVYILALLLITDWKYKLIIFIFTPLILLIFGFTTNPIFDYLIALYGFGGFMFVNLKNLSKWIGWFELLLWSVVGFFIAFVANTISGIIFFQASFVFSVGFNGFFNLVNFVVIVPVLFLIIKNISWNCRLVIN